METRMKSNGEQKTCSHCRAVLTCSSFHKDRTTPDGLCGWCRSCIKERTYKLRHRPGYLAARRRDALDWYYGNKERVFRNNRERNRRYRFEALCHYAGNPPQCMCPGGCGEHRVEFLTFDHIAGGGKVHRQRTSNASIGSWLKSHKYPAGIR